MSRNVTIDPWALATAVEDPEIREIRSLRSGLILDTTRFISRQRYDRLIRSRNQILEEMKKGNPRFVCAICSGPVYLVSSPTKSFFFRHQLEDGRCPAQTRGLWSAEEIRAMKYHGARESEAHKRTKDQVRRTLEADPRFSDVGMETRWASRLDKKVYRRPDVQAKYLGNRIAFEVQLTTTFLDVAVGRRLFYRDEGAQLIWVLRRFDPDYRRLTEDDILFTNNSNVFVVDNVTVEASELDKRAYLKCHYRQTSLDDGQRVARWESAVVALDELTFDQQGARVFFFDVDANDRQVEAELQRQIAEGLAAQESELRERAATCLAHYDEEREAEWLELVDQLDEIDVEVPIRPDQGSFRRIVCALLSVKAGRPIGYKYKQLIEVVHLFAEAYKDHLLVLGWALIVFERHALLEEQDRLGKWKRKRSKIRAFIEANAQEYQLNESWLPAIRFMFPELDAQVSAYLAKQAASGSRASEGEETQNGAGEQYP
jgi:competence CoiA-like predicted nuclease